MVRPVAVGQSRQLGKEGAKQFFGMVHQAFPDLHAEIHDVIAEAARVTYSGRSWVRARQRVGETGTTAVAWSAPAASGQPSTVVQP